MDLFSNLKNFFKTTSTTIDNSIFRLHYKATALILVAFSILVTARQYIGDPIDCDGGKDVPTEMLDSFCWVHTTFSMPDAWHKKVGSEVPYPGVAKYSGTEERVFHAYYQWVCFVLFLQAIMFYAPRYFWKAIEGGRLKNLTLGLNSPIVAEETKTQNKKLLVEYIAVSRGSHKVYFVGYTVSEILNFVNVVGQMFLINTFLGGEFSKYGLQVLQFTEWDGSVRYDPMIKVFPRITKCFFHKYGTSGDVQSINAICVLPINIINEKIYIFLWFWFIILAILSGLVLVYRSVLVFWPTLRFIVTSHRARITNHANLDIVINGGNISDWFLLDLLSKNLDPVHFKDVVNDLADVVEEKKYIDRIV